MVKIYVDSRYRIGGTNEDFVWQIPESVDLPESLCYIDTVLVPNVFWTVKAGYNDKLRFLEEIVITQGGNSTTYACQATIAPGQYNGITLASAVQTAMRAVSNLANPTEIQVVYEASQSRLKISTTALYGTQIAIYPDALLTQGTGNWNSVQGLFPVDPLNTQSAGKVCGFLGDTRLAASATLDVYGDSVIDVQRHHVCFIHSDLGLPGSSYGPQGQSDIIRRVVIDSPQNGLAIDRFTTAHESVHVGSRSLRSMSFRLAGVDGETVDLRGHHWSFSLIFHEKI